MAEQTPTVQNKGMLILALVLGAAVVLIYYWQIRQVRLEGRGEMMYLVRFERTMKPGEKIDSSKDVSAQEVPKQFEGRLGDTVILKDPGELKSINGLMLNRHVEREQYLMTNQITQEATAGPSVNIDQAMVAITVPLKDPPGNILRQGDKVNLIGAVARKNARALPERILSAVKVLEVGGRALKESYVAGRGYDSSDEGSTSYRSITIEVTPDVSLKLAAMLPLISGGIRIEVLNPGRRAETNDGKIDDGLYRDVMAGLPGGAAPAAPGGAAATPPAVVR